MGNNKKRVILLSVLLLIILVIGIFVVIRNRDNNKNESFQEGKGDSGKESNKFYYVEEFIDESIWEGNGYDKLFKYSEKIVRFKNGFLQDIKAKENIYEIPDIEYDGGYLCISENEIWNVKYNNDSKKIIINYFDNKGNKKGSIELKDFKGEILDDSYIMVEDMKVTDDYICILTYNDSRPSRPILQIFTKAGELKHTYDDILSFDVDSKGRCIYTVDRLDIRGFFMIDLESGSEIFRNDQYILSPIRFSWDGKLICGFDIMNGNIKAFDEKGIIVIDSLLEIGEDTTYFLDDYVMRDLTLGEDEEIYCILKTKLNKDQDIDLMHIKSLVYSYTKREGERAKRETVLTITAPYRNDFITEAIKRYELKYPDEHVEYNYTYNNISQFSENAEEYVSKLNLDIIQGSVGDIVQTGGAGIEIHNILAIDAFMDLTDLIEKDESYKDLNKDVLNALKINNAIRGVPITYAFYQYELNENLEKELGLNIDFNNISWSEVLDIVKIIEEKAPDRHLFTQSMEGKGPWDIFEEYLLIANMPDLINLETKEVDLSQQWFKDLLIKFKECSKSNNFVLGDAEFSLTDRLQGSLLALTSNKGNYYGDRLIHFNEYNKINRSRMIPNFKGEKNDNRVGYSMSMYSINNRSERKENAWEFLSFLLEEDTQFIASKDRTGIPINKKGVHRMIEDAVVMHRLSGSNIDGYNNAMIENSHKIDYLYNMGYLRRDISEPVGLYMEDKITLDEALKKAEKNVMIRLNE